MKSIPCEGKVRLTAVLGGVVGRAAGDVPAAAAARAGVPVATGPTAVAVAAGPGLGVGAGGAPGAQVIASATLAVSAARRTGAIGVLRGRREPEPVARGAGDRRRAASSWPGAPPALASVVRPSRNYRGMYGGGGYAHQKSGSPSRGPQTRGT